jgi:hypothetical protein
MGRDSTRPSKKSKIITAARRNRMVWRPIFFFNRKPRGTSMPP